MAEVRYDADVPCHIIFASLKAFCFARLLEFYMLCH